MRKEESRHYYSLRLRGNTGYYRSGDEFRGSQAPLLIGELSDCDVRFKPESPDLAPEYYAAILPDQEPGEWRIVPMSDYVTVTISGHGPVEIASVLQSGDRISFSGQDASLTFHTHCDSAYRDNGRIIVSRPNNRTAYTLFLLLLLILVGGAFLLHDNLRQIKSQDLEPYANSVYLIRVDSVDCVFRKANQPDSLIWIENFADGHSEVGTAFLTNSGELITARHCVEFWLGQDPDLQEGISHLDPDDLIRRIAEAETYNYSDPSESGSYQVRAYCSATNEADSIGLHFRSDTIMIDRSRDNFIVYDDFHSRYYWRSISPAHQRRDMEQGDIAVARVGKHGKIALASEERLRTLRNGSQIGLLGYPESGIDVRAVDFSKGTYQLPMSIESDMIVTKGDATHGYSGAPLFVRDGRSYVVAGVLSKVDPVNEELKYSVPITNLRKLHDTP